MKAQEIFVDEDGSMVFAQLRKGEEYSNGPDVEKGHIIPLDSDEGIQELLDAHPEFVSRREQWLAEWIAKAQSLSMVDPEGHPNTKPETWIETAEAFAKEKKDDTP